MSILIDFCHHSVISTRELRERSKSQTETLTFMLIFDSNVIKQLTKMIMIVIT